jgi:uncharacterized Zn finger protein (UPF0148 family)
MINKGKKKCSCGNPGPLKEFDGEYLCPACIKEKEDEWEKEKEWAWDANDGYGDSDGSSEGDWIND